MKKDSKNKVMRPTLLIGMLLLAAGCVSSTPIQEARVRFPVENYAARANYKRFGEFFDDRFHGYHVGEDLEAEEWWVEGMKTTGYDIADDIRRQEEAAAKGLTLAQEPDFEDRLGSYAAVQSIAKGVVTYAEWVAGYGGVMVVNHAALCEDASKAECEPLSAVYGHLNAQAFRANVGDQVEKGQVLGYLGVQGPQTDNERSHLHFALYKGEDIRLKGYVKSPEELEEYVNPRIFLENYGLSYDDEKKTQKLFTLIEPSGRTTFPLDMEIPSSWDVEWVPSLEAWNLYDTRGSGSARERSQLFIRYFDASQFLTLSSVTIHETTDLTVGRGEYTARRYDIEKKPAVADFNGQPLWRNRRHLVTDFRAGEGRTRYFVIAANPDLDPKVYENVLNSMEIL